MVLTNFPRIPSPQPVVLRCARGVARASKGGGPRRCSPTASCAAGQGASGGARAVRPSRAAARPPQDDGIWDGGDDMSVSRRQVMTGSLAMALAGRAAAQEADWPRVIEAARQE